MAVYVKLNANSWLENSMLAYLECIFLFICKNHIFSEWVFFIPISSEQGKKNSKPCCLLTFMSLEPSPLIWPVFLLFKKLYFFSQRLQYKLLKKGYAKDKTQWKNNIYQRTGCVCGWCKSAQVLLSNSTSIKHSWECTPLINSKLSWLYWPWREQKKKVLYICVAVRDSYETDNTEPHPLDQLH